MIEIEGLHITRGGATLRDLSLRVAEGESVALVGEDQRSLTQLVRCCGGLVRPDRGTVRVTGIDIGTASRHALLDLRRAVGYVSVHGGLLANMTLRANVELPLRYHGVGDRPSIASRAQELFDQSGLASVADERAAVVPAELQKCVAYLRAVAMRPRVLLAEDPSALLHPQGRRIVEGLHQRLRADGVTVLVTDDDTEFAERITDRQVNITGAAA